MSAATWEQRMADKAAVRRTEQEAAERAQSIEGYSAWQERQRVEFLTREPLPPGGCFDCFRAGPHPSFGVFQWFHVWPDSQPFSDWTCTHECHGPGGQEVLAIAFG